MAAGMTALARHDNVSVKLGALPVRRIRMRLGRLADHFPPRRSRQLGGLSSKFASSSSARRRCMFESNFPVQKRWCSYAVLWNACKRLAAGASADEKSALFSGTAARVYRLPAAMA